MGKPKKKPVAEQPVEILERAPYSSTVVRYRLETVALATVHASPTNPRKHFDEAKLAELTESIRGSGVLQPLLLRPHPELAGEFECVAGERRRRAATAAGIVEVPANIREMGDREVLELQLTENSQRVDAHALEEADAIAHLHEAPHHVPVEEIAAKLGKSIAYVYSRLRLCALGEAARTAFVDGVLSASVALLLSRLSNPKLQEKATKDLVRAFSYHSAPASMQEARRILERDYFLKLAEAPFPTAQIDLTDAEACTSCPKRSGNQGQLFAEVDVEDTCTDPPCFADKVSAGWKQRAKQAQQGGQKVLSAKEAKETFPTSYSEPKGFVTLDQRCHEDPKGRTYGQLLKKAVIGGDTVLALNPHTHRPAELVPQGAVKKLLKEAGHDFKRTEPRISPKQKAHDERRAKPKQLRELVDRRAQDEAVSTVTDNEPSRELWLALLELQAEYDDERVAALLRRGSRRLVEQLTQKENEAEDPADVGELLDKAQHTEATLRALFFESMLSQRHGSMALGRLGVDLDALERDARKELGLGKAPDPLSVVCPMYACGARKGDACRGGRAHWQRAEAAELAGGDALVDEDDEP